MSVGPPPLAKLDFCFVMFFAHGSIQLLFNAPNTRLKSQNWLHGYGLVMSVNSNMLGIAPLHILQGCQTSFTSGATYSRSDYESAGAVGAKKHNFYKNTSVFLHDKEMLLQLIKVICQRDLVGLNSKK